MAHDVVVGVDEEDPVEARRLVDVTDRVVVRARQADAVEWVLRHGQVLELVPIGPLSSSPMLNCWTVPCSILTLSKPPVLLIPSAVALLTPSIVCPPRSSLMLLAPITRPSPGQFRRSFFTCVLCVITWPQVTFWASAGLAPTANKTATAAARTPSRTSNRSR